jgi:hypothetical protein
MTHISVFTLLYRNVTEFGECIGNCLDIQQSFGDRMCLHNVFMQCFIQCFHDDYVNHHPSINKNRLVLDVNVGVCNLSLIPT